MTSVRSERPRRPGQARILALADKYADAGSDIRTGDIANSVGVAASTVAKQMRLSGRFQPVGRTGVWERLALPAKQLELDADLAALVGLVLPGASRDAAQELAEAVQGHRAAPPWPRATKEGFVRAVLLACEANATYDPQTIIDIVLGTS